MPKISEVYNRALQEGKGKDILSNDVRILIAADNGFREPVDTLFHRDDEMKNLPLFEEQFQRLLKQEPVEYILGEARFLQFRLKVDKRVLIPRMETAELVSHISEEITNWYDPRNYLVVADVGTGSGCIALALRSLFPNWLITASDVSEDALDVAKENFHSYNLPIRTLKGSDLDPYIEAHMNLDLIVSNPPYILNQDEVQDSVKNFEPATALYLDKNHSVYEEIFKKAYQVKKGSLLMAFEIGYDLEDYLKGLMNRYLHDYDFTFEEDMNGLTRFLFVFLH